MNNAALILAAGAGTRMKSAQPKVTHTIMEKPLVRWVVDAARGAGLKNVVTIVGHGRDVVEPLVQDTTVVVQQQQLGTAHAVLSAREACAQVDGSLVVLTGDSPLVSSETIQRLMQVREENDAAVVVLTMKVDNPFGYGRIVRDESGQISAIVEQKDCNPEQALLTECNSGFYCFDAQMVFEALTQVSTENAQGEYYLTDVVAIARQAGKKVMALVADDATECLGVNSRAQLAQATHYLQQRINCRHMDAGVTIMDPATTWIGPDVEIENDVTILPMSFLYGTTSVASGTVVGPHTRLTNTVVGHDCVLDETIAIDAQIDNNVECGPRAYLRPQTHLCDNAKAGTHVEIKKSTVGEGSKVPHLSYIGDTTIGADVNIGAGSITCNYDGRKKWPTTIGDNAFIGSDTMMVAPVNIGDNALIAAGSVITSDVPSYALGLGRARQTIKEGYRKTKE